MMRVPGFRPVSSASLYAMIFALVVWYFDASLPGVSPGRTRYTMPFTGGMYSFWPGVSSLPVRLLDQIILLDVTLNLAATFATVSPLRTMYNLISLLDLKADATTCGLLTRL